MIVGVKGKSWPFEIRTGETQIKTHSLVEQLSQYNAYLGKWWWCRVSSPIYYCCYFNGNSNNTTTLSRRANGFKGPVVQYPYDPILNCRLCLIASYILVSDTSALQQPWQLGLALVSLLIYALLFLCASTKIVQL